MTRLAPADAGECARLLKDATGATRTVRVRGAGTKDHLGELLPTDDVLETTRLAGVVEHVPADLTVTVGAGTRLADVQRALAERGQMLPLDPPFADAATIGGIVAADSAGLGMYRYGGVRDLLIGTTTALADGTVARAGGRVVKNVAGYDLDKLLVGSLGTLGVMTEVTLKVVPIPQARACSASVTRDATEAFSRAAAIMRTSLRPTALVVERAGRVWRLVIAAEGDGPMVERAMREARGERATDVDAVLAPLRDLVATAVDGAVVRASLPLAAQRAFADAAVGLETVVRLVADAATGITRVHLRGDDAAVIRGATALIGAARAVGGNARAERRSSALRERLPAWSADPPGLFLMRRIKERFDPAGILEPGRAPV